MVLLLLELTTLSSGAQDQPASLAREISVSKTIPGSIACSPDGRYLALAGTTGDFSSNPVGAPFNLQMTNPKHVLLLLETGGYKVKRQLWKGPEKGLPFAGSGEPLMFSADGLTLFSMYDGSIHAWDVEKGIKTGSWGQGLSDIAFSADSRVALARRSAGGVEAFDLHSGRSLGQFTAPEAGKPIVTGPEGLYVVSRSDQGVMLRNLRAAEDRQLGLLPGKSITAAAVSADGQVIAVGTDSGHVAFWRLADGNKIGEQPGAGKGVHSLALKADGSLLAYVAESKLRLVSLGTGSSSAFATKHAFGVGSVRFGKDPATLFTLGSMVDPVIQLWKLNSSVVP
jgi:WD40 repeat protein